MNFWLPYDKMEDKYHINLDSIEILLNTIEDLAFSSQKGF